MAKDLTEGATVYVTLEPCSHFGRTPPCSLALIEAKVAKVICAMEDPNPKVSGRGIRMLRDAGIDVQVGLLEQDAHKLNTAFIKRMKGTLPFVQLKMGASLDGQTALANGQSQWITSTQARRDVQVYRAKSCAVLSTSQTVIEDNASLNVRWEELPESIQFQYSKDSLRQPTRVILDSKANLSENAKLLSTDGPILLLNGKGSSKSTEQQESAEQITRAVGPVDSQGQFKLRETLESLVLDHHINQLWVEAGATLASSLLKEQLVDEIVLYLAPKLMGSDGRGLFGALGLESMADIIELDITDIRKVGADIRIVATVNYQED